MQDAGLHVMWIESDILGENTTEHVMAGNDYRHPNANGSRAPKITIQAMWQLFLQQLIDSGGNLNDLVVTCNCCIFRMIPGEAELVSEWTGREKV